MKKNVLVFPCGSEVGFEIYRSVNLSTHFNLYGGSSVSDHGQFVYENYIDNIPFVTDPEFINKINKVVEEYNIDFIFPAHDSVVLKLAQEKSKGTLKCEVVTSPAATCEVARSKRRTYEVFEKIIPTPFVYKNAGTITKNDFPIFLKPDVGEGAKGTHKVNTVSDIEFYYKKDSTLLLLEYLPEEEYTIDCFTDRNGKLLFCEGRERTRVSNGISVNSQIVQDKRFLDLANRINNTLTFRGVWFFQVKKRLNDELVLMEIAPRVAGAMGLTRCRGVNLPLLALFDAGGSNVSIFANDYEIVIDRALYNSFKHNINYEHVYLDFDDLVIFEDKVNIAAIAFVYQCINKHVKVHLLTKHKSDLSVTLKKYRLENIFDEVIWIKDGEEKSEYIKEDNAILIDDSFAERESVYRKRKIPVFDAHMIEGLMEG